MRAINVATETTSVDRPKPNPSPSAILLLSRVSESEYDDGLVELLTAEVLFVFAIEFLIMLAAVPIAVVGKATGSS